METQFQNYIQNSKFIKNCMKQSAECVMSMILHHYTKKIKIIIPNMIIELCCKYYGDFLEINAQEICIDDDMESRDDICINSKILLPHPIKQGNNIYHMKSVKGMGSIKHLNVCITNSWIFQLPKDLVLIFYHDLGDDVIVNLHFRWELPHKINNGSIIINAEGMDLSLLISSVPSTNIYVKCNQFKNRISVQDTDNHKGKVIIECDNCNKIYDPL